MIIRCKNLALYIRDCVSLCLSDETLKAVGPFYLVSMPGVVKDPASLHWKCVTCIQAWSPYLRKVKLIPELRDRYEERLKECGLATLETRRLRGVK